MVGEKSKDVEIWAQIAAKMGVDPAKATLHEDGRVYRLRLNECNLQSLPSEIGQLSNLIVLELWGNQLQSLPSEIGQLSNLTVLALRENKLRTLPSEIGQLSKLVTLDLGNNELQSLPSEILDLTQLTALYLYSNQLRELPSGIGRLANLSILFLTNNQLQILPSEICELTNLDSLYLGKNQLQSLPPQIGQLSSLVRLNLRGNQLQTLPSEIGQLSNLTMLDLELNTIETPPHEIVAQGTEAILEYLRGLLDDTLVRYEAKLLLVGEGGTGKSSILNALQGKAFVEGLSSTHGIDVVQLQLDHPILRDTLIKLNLWDFGGQEIYHATHQFFLTEQSLYLVVWNARLGSDQGKLDYWLNLIKSLAPDSPVLLVATFADPTNPDEREPDLNYQAYKEAYPNIVGILSIINRSGQGFDELKRVIAEEAAKLRLVGEPWPRKWLRVEEALMSMPEHHIDTSKYVQCCDEFGVEREAAQGTLGRYFYYLGKLLYFPEDDQLANMIVLKPNWITKAISKVLEDPETKQNGGLLRHDHLPLIWMQDEDGVTYDRHLFPAFLRLMEKFDLSYEIETALPGEPEVSLIPELLPHQPPDELAQWPQEPANGQVELKMDYKLDFLPAGIISWFIVRTHHYTEDTKGLHWRDGVILGYEGHKAKVELSKPLKTISLVVHGPSPHNFFTILMKTIDLIMDRFPGLSIERRIPCICHRHGGNLMPCPRHYLYEDLVRRMERRKAIVECPETFVDVPVAEMLFGIHSSTMEDVVAKIDELIEGQNQLKELVTREFARQWNYEMKRIEAECPNTFFLKTGDNWRADPRNWVSKEYRLTLVCQHPPGPHPVGEDYKLRETSEWWAAISPWLTHLVKFMKHAVPLGVAVGGVYDGKAMDEMKEGTALLEVMTAQLPNELFKTGGMDRARLEAATGADSHRIEGAALRALYNYLKEVDKAQVWGGLLKVVTLDGNILWVCDYHKKEYDR